MVMDEGVNSRCNGGVACRGPCQASPVLPPPHSRPPLLDQARGPLPRAMEFVLFSDPASLQQATPAAPMFVEVGAWGATFGSDSDKDR